MAGMEHKPSTPRTRRLREALLGQKQTICADRSVLVTASYQQTEGMHPAIRQALAFDKVLSEMPIWIRDGELIAGNVASRPNGSNIFPEYDCEWMESELDTISTRAGDRYILLEEDRKQLEKCFQYWPGKTLLHLAHSGPARQVLQSRRPRPPDPGPQEGRPRGTRRNGEGSGRAPQQPRPHRAF
jgi:formate C-acetyltransferase